MNLLNKFTINNRLQKPGAAIVVMVFPSDLAFLNAEISFNTLSIKEGSLIFNAFFVSPAE